MSAVPALGMLIIAVAAGQFLYWKFGNASDTFYALWRIIFATTWMFSGLALMFGGYTIFGAAVFAFFFFIFRGGASDLRTSVTGGSDTRRDING